MTALAATLFTIAGLAAAASIARDLPRWIEASAQLRAASDLLRADMERAAYLMGV